MAIYVVQEIIEDEPQKPILFYTQAAADVCFDEICEEMSLLDEDPKNDSAIRVAGDDVYSIHMWELAGINS